MTDIWLLLHDGGWKLSLFWGVIYERRHGRLIALHFVYFLRNESWLCSVLRLWF